MPKTTSKETAPVALATADRSEVIAELQQLAAEIKTLSAQREPLNAETRKVGDTLLLRLRMNHDKGFGTLAEALSYHGKPRYGDNGEVADLRRSLAEKTERLNQIDLRRGQLAESINGILPVLETARIDELNAALSAKRAEIADAIRPFCEDEAEVEETTEGFSALTKIRGRINAWKSHADNPADRAAGTARALVHELSQPIAA